MALFVSELWFNWQRCSMTDVFGRAEFRQTCTQQEQHVRLQPELKVSPGGHQKSEGSEAQAPSQPSEGARVAQDSLPRDLSL